MKVKEANRPVAGNLEAILCRKGIKKVFLARQAGMTPQELSDIINGRRLVKACEIPVLARSLGVGVGDLFAQEDGGG